MPTEAVVLLLPVPITIQAAVELVRMSSSITLALQPGKPFHLSANGLNLQSHSSGGENCFTQFIYQSYGQSNPENWVGCVASPRNFYVTSPTGKQTLIRS
jgi:hypothetical protein